MKVGDLVKHAYEDWWGIIIEIRHDPNLKSKWLEIYCSEKNYIFGRWDSQVVAI